jgi:hypothetical protein
VQCLPRYLVELTVFEPGQNPVHPSPAIIPDLEKMTHAALDGMDAKDCTVQPRMVLR